jgi:hypothetical protein
MAFTEYYCQNGGSNLNAGSTTNNTAAYTSVNGNWDFTNKIFTPVDGSTPASTVSVGDFASVFLDAATVTAYIGRVITVAAGANGAITLSGSAFSGTAPATGATGRTVKVGGAWKGPNGASVFPFGSQNYANLTNIAGNPLRLNIKNDQTYSITAALGGAPGFEWVQGYSSTLGDGGRATFDGGTTTIAILNPGGQTTSWIADLILKSSATAGSNAIVLNVSSGTKFYRVTVMGGRGSGFQIGGTASKFIECEAYDNNKSNTAGNAGFLTTVSSMSFYRCIAAGNSGSNTDGFRYNTGSDIRISQCVSFNNGRHGFALAANSNSIQEITNCDAYNNGGDGVNNTLTTTVSYLLMENCNLIKNTGYGVNSALTTGNWHGLINNCGFGSGTMQNGSGATNNLSNVIVSGSVTYEANVNPYNDPANGDFRLVATNTRLHLGTGRGTFTETQGGFAGTVGYPDVGAAQTSLGNAAQVSYGFNG